MLLHGDADADVPVEESRTMAAALEAVGLLRRYLEVPGAGHGFDVDAVHLGAMADPNFEQVLEFLEHELLSRRGSRRPDSPV